MPEVAEDLVNDGRIVDAGNDLHCTATVLAGFDVDPKHAFETLGPCHGAVLFRFAQVWVRVASPAAPCRGDLRAKAAVRG